MSRVGSGLSLGAGGTGGPLIENEVAFPAQDEKSPPKHLCLSKASRGTNQSFPHRASLCVWLTCNFLGGWEPVCAWGAPAGVRAVPVPLPGTAGGNEGTSRVAWNANASSLEHASFPALFDWVCVRSPPDHVRTRGHGLGPSVGAQTPECPVGADGQEAQGPGFSGTMQATEGLSTPLFLGLCSQDEEPVVHGKARPAARGHRGPACTSVPCTRRRKARAPAPRAGGSRLDAAPSASTCRPRRR